MDYCYIEFASKDTNSLYRAIELFTMIKVAKKTDDTTNDRPFINYLTDAERSYFGNPSPEEEQEWSDEWFSTPLEIRHSSRMLTPPWDLESMLYAFWIGDYELIDIQEQKGKYYLRFDPHGYPYGGTGCMVALLECFGHRVVGINDGAGYEKYTPETELWKPKQKG